MPIPPGCRGKTSRSTPSGRSAPAPWPPDDPEMQYHRESALDNLEKAFNKYKESDYSEENWKKLVAAYEQGIADINAALPAEDFIENNIIAALNKALAAMQAIPADHAGRIEVAVSMDANTLSLGYLINRPWSLWMTVPPARRGHYRPAQREPATTGRTPEALPTASTWPV